MQFEVYNNTYNEIENHRKIVSDECLRWEKKIDEYLEKSFALCHFQGKELKKLAISIFQKYEFPIVLQRILQNNSGEAITADTFFKFLNTGRFRTRRDIAVK